MAHTARLRKVGGSVMLAIPRAVLDALDLKSDAMVGMSVRAGKLLVEPNIPKRYTLDELLAQCSSKTVFEKEEREWLDAPAVGREII
jgi:antitoxin ChpS